MIKKLRTTREKEGRQREEEGLQDYLETPTRGTNGRAESVGSYLNSCSNRNLSQFLALANAAVS